MLYDLIKKTWKPLIFVALVSLVISWAFNISSLIVQPATINGIRMYTFNIRNYFANITNSWTTNALNFEDILPEREYMELTGTIIDEDFWEAMINNLALTFDWIYFPINFILWLFRWLCWIIRIMLALIGWNIGKNPLNEEYYSQLAEILEWCIINLKIDYI